MQLKIEPFRHPVSMDPKYAGELNLHVVLNVMPTSLKLLATEPAYCCG